MAERDDIPTNVRPLDAIGPGAPPPDTSGARRWQRWLQLDTVPEPELAIFWRQLALRIEVGVPLLKALSQIAERTSHAALRQVIQHVAADIEAGNSLSEARCRVNLLRQHQGVGAVFRLLPSHIRGLEELGLPQVVYSLARLEQGLVLVTGPTGSGKSTTLAAIIDYINQEHDKHIVTIEDPLEFIHPSKKSLVTQREVGAHTLSFAAALRAVLREDPDIILLGELRDLETISLAITAAETGHLVFGTLHTRTAASTVDRLIDVFPPDQQGQIRTMLAETLKGVIAQQLLIRADGQGRLVAVEILVGTTALANLVREGKTYQLPSLIQTGRREGMQTMDQAILEHLRSKQITPQEAYRKAIDKDTYRQYLERL